MGRWEPTPNPDQEGNMGRWEPTPNPDQEGNMGRWGRFLLRVNRVSQRDCSRFVPKAPCEQVSKYTAQPIPKELTYHCYFFSLT
ncbi:MULTISPECIES: hypothetical protein, partial [unclassified Moorena]|uniref:hypothetical protein n=2 Tax=Moorena TaxID=1155738 RepID=UPI0013C9C8EC